MHLRTFMVSCKITECTSLGVSICSEKKLKAAERVMDFPHFHSEVSHVSLHSIITDILFHPISWRYHPKKNKKHILIICTKTSKDTHTWQHSRLNHMHLPPTIMHGGPNSWCFCTKQIEGLDTMLIRSLSCILEVGIEIGTKCSMHTLG